MFQIIFNQISASELSSLPMELQLEILEQRWNGQFPQVVGSDALPLLQMPQK